MVTTHALSDGGGGGALVSVASLPPVETDERALHDAAEALTSASDRVRTHAEGAQTVWGGLPSVYEASGTEPLYSQLDPAASQADEVAVALGRAGDALLEFATAVSTLKIDRAELVSRIEATRERYLAAEPDSPELLVASGEMTRLRLDVSTFAGAVEIAEQTCMDALAEIRGGTSSGTAGAGVLALSGSSYAAALGTALTAAMDPLEQLTLLAGMTPEQAAAWLAQNPGFADVLAVSDPPAADVAAWWAAVEASPHGAALAAALIAGMPQALGNLDGVPYWARSESNTLVLDEQIEAAEAAFAGVEGSGFYDEWGRYWVSDAEGDAQEHLDQLLGIRTAMNRDGVHQLIEFHPGEPPLAAVSTGDVDTATHIGVIVPGINSTRAGMNGAVAGAETLQEAQSDLDPEARPAVIAWMGYETPSMFTVWESSYAETGGENLGVTLDGLDATNPGATTTVYAHSYGSTTAAEALRYDDHGVDALAMYGSAGLTVDSVDDLALPADDVWAGEAYDDEIADIGRVGGSEHPHDPTDDDFGAQVYTVPPSGTWLWNAHDQAEYFQDEGLDNLAAIGMGRTDLVSRGAWNPPPVELIGP